MKTLNPILSVPLRLMVVSILIKLKMASFTYLLEKTNSTQGNLSRQLSKLKEEGYIKIEKKFENNYPKTECFITPKGVKAFDEHVKNLKNYLHLD